MSTLDCPAGLVELAHDLADLAGGVHRQHFRRPLAVDSKPDGSPVTAVDRDAERVMRERIERAHPDHGIEGEEYPSRNAAAEYVWHINPLDGTKLFLSGVPLFGTLISLSRSGHFLLGLVDQPILRDRWLGANGHGTVLNGKSVRTRACESLSQAGVCTYGPDGHAAPFDDAIRRVGTRAKWMRYGAECYDFGLLAAGFSDAYLDAGLAVHDFAPLEVLVRNAGGSVTDWEGRPLTTESDGKVLAVGDGRLLPELLDELHGRTAP